TEAAAVLPRRIRTVRGLNVVALAARVVLAIVLARAAVAKLRAGAATRRQMVALLGDRAGPVVALVLPWAELIVAVLLIVWWNAVPGGADRRAGARVHRSRRPRQSAASSVRVSRRKRVERA